MSRLPFSKSWQVCLYHSAKKSKMTKTQIKGSCLKQIFSEQGIPQIVRTDNGPQFNSKEFSEFSSVYGFKHVTSSPHYPRSNGLIESQVKIVKRTLEKVAKDNGDLHLALLYLRSIPVDSKLPSPAQLLQHRSFHGHSSKDSG